MKTIISIKVSVPVGDYCVNHDDHSICEYFDNEGGHPTCDIDRLFKGYDSLNYDNNGRVPKLSACLNGNDE